MHEAFDRSESQAHVQQGATHIAAKVINIRYILRSNFSVVGTFY